MQHSSIPTCYFPSTALFLDDNHDFLLNFVLQIDEGVAYRTFDSPRKALDYIHHKRCELDLVSQHCLIEYKEARNRLLTHHTTNHDLAAIHAEVYNPHRFSEISVVVVDYSMPEMDGLEFCRQIGNSNIKKILLTGQADEKLIVDAFNEGLIDRFIKKSDPNAAEQVTKSIYELQIQYFQTMSEMVVRLLSLTPPACLRDKNFAKLFRRIREQQGIVEYYLVDNSGSFFMLDDDAKVSFLIVKNQEDIRFHHHLGLDLGASELLLSELLNGEKIPGFWPEDQTNAEGRDWFGCLVPAQRLVSDETYYYTYLPGHTRFDVRQHKILSYHRFLEELDAEELLID